MRVLFILSFLVVLVSARPENVKWMELIPAKELIHSEYNNHDDKVILSYAPYRSTWELFKKTHGKSYDSYEETHRYSLFLNNLAYIESHNKDYKAGKKSFYLGVNQYADYDVNEFRVLNGFRDSKNSSAFKGSAFLRSSFVSLPQSVDWRTEGYVTPVKNQGQCGSCWSFSATGSLEGQHFKHTGKLVSLSEQQLVDCSTSFGNHGCSGGLMDKAFEYVKKIGGIDSEQSYPYLAEQEQRCHFKRSSIAAHCTGFVDIPQGSETDLQHATATVGPISVAIDARHKSFMLYSGGVYDEPQCSRTQLDHGVLVVGYGSSQTGGDYWIVKNSWGLTWGEEGYVLMSRNKNDQCGIASQASYPLV